MYVKYVYLCIWDRSIAWYYLMYLLTIHQQVLWSMGCIWWCPVVGIVCMFGPKMGNASVEWSLEGCKFALMFAWFLVKLWCVDSQMLLWLLFSKVIVVLFLFSLSYFCTLSRRGASYLMSNCCFPSYCCLIFALAILFLHVQRASTDFTQSRRKCGFP